MMSRSFSGSSSSSKASLVGKETLSFCSSCKMDLNHTIVAMQGDLIRKVQCRTCKKEHMYKAPKGVKDPTVIPPKAEKAARASGSAAPKSTPIEVEWEKLMSSHRSTPLRVYSAKGSFKAGDRLSHPTFGEGVVSKLLHPNKIEVIFQMDLKILIHAGENAGS